VLSPRLVEALDGKTVDGWRNPLAGYPHLLTRRAVAVMQSTRWPTRVREGLLDGVECLAQIGIGGFPIQGSSAFSNTTL